MSDDIENQPESPKCSNRELGMLFQAAKNIYRLSEQTRSFSEIIARALEAGEEQFAVEVANQIQQGEPQDQQRATIVQHCLKQMNYELAISVAETIYWLSLRDDLLSRITADAMTRGDRALAAVAAGKIDNSVKKDACLRRIVGMTTG